MSDTRPRFSVVTIVYNQGQYIADNIESVLAQDCDNVEHIIVDGGSTDDTHAVCARYPHVTFIEAPGTNQSQALNIGFARAHGEIIAWLNSDDYYEADIFTRVAELIDAGHSAVTGRARVVDELKNTLWYLKAREVNPLRLLHHPLLYRLKGRHCLPCQPATFFHRRVYDALGGLKEDLQFGMDYDYWLRMAAAGYRFCRVDDLFANYRYHDTSKTVQDGYDRFLPEWQAVADEHRRALPPARRAAAGIFGVWLHLESALYRSNTKAMEKLNQLRGPDRASIPTARQLWIITCVLARAPWLLLNILRHVAAPRRPQGTTDEVRHA